MNDHIKAAVIHLAQLKPVRVNILHTIFRKFLCWRL